MYLHEKRFITGILIHRLMESPERNILIIPMGRTKGYVGSCGEIPLGELRALSGQLVLAKAYVVSEFYQDTQEIEIKRFTLIDIKRVSSFNEECEIDLHIDSDSSDWSLQDYLADGGQL